jgi:hypothetical protein
VGGGIYRKRVKTKQARSRGVRNPGRNALISGLITAVSIGLVLLGFADTSATGRSGSPLVMLGLFPALLGPIFFVHYLRMIRVFRDLRSGRTAIARWTLTAEQFRRFCEDEQRVPASSIMTNFYLPPRAIPAEGVQVIFSRDGVLIGDGYFPLSTTRGRRVKSVEYLASGAPAIEFGTVMNTAVRTSSAGVKTVRISEKLRVPVAPDALAQAGEVVRHYQSVIAQR